MAVVAKSNSVMVEEAWQGGCRKVDKEDVVVREVEMSSIVMCEAHRCVVGFEGSGMPAECTAAALATTVLAQESRDGQRQKGNSLLIPLSDWAHAQSLDRRLRLPAHSHRD